jgi:hypothetical protein
VGDSRALFVTVSDDPSERWRRATWFAAMAIEGPRRRPAGDGPGKETVGMGSGGDGGDPQGRDRAG